MAEADSVATPVHSALGASGADRWLHCPGSAALLARLAIPEQTTEADYQALGSHAHEALAYCSEMGLEAWTQIGMEFYGIALDPEIAEAIQGELDIRKSIVDSLGEGGVFGIEYRISDPSFHPKFFGTVDWWATDGNKGYVRDYKNGRLLVEVKDNPQLLYYALGLLRSPQFAAIETVEVALYQPRGFHHDGADRRVTYTREFVERWAEDVLRPAMFNAEAGGDLQAGSWCRFCPAKLVCPLVTGIFGAAALANPKDLVYCDDAELGRRYSMLEAVTFAVKAIKEEALARSLKGIHIAGTKLVHGKVDRVWKPDAQEVMVARFGDDAMTTPVLKSPAQMEKIKAIGVGDAVKEWAYKPPGSLTLAREDDSRVAVKVTPGSETFAVALDKLKMEA